MYFRFFHIILMKLSIITILSSPIKVLDKGILPLQRDSVAIQFFLDFENCDKMNPCKMYVRPTNCCLYTDKDRKGCDSMKLYGETLDILKPNDRKIYLYVYPTLEQLNQQGHCYFTLQYRCRKKSPPKSQNNIKISFDTRYGKRNQYLLKNFKGRKLSQCKGADNDPLNKCKPVNCDKKYSGEKPFYDRNASLCVKAPECMSASDKMLPDKAYEPHSNTCKDLGRSLSVNDIYLLASGVTVKTPPYNEEIKLSYRANCSTVSQNVYFLRDMLLGKLHSLNNNFKIDYTESCNNAIMSILSCVMGVSTVMIMCICCATVMVWAYEQWKLGGFRGKVGNLRSRIISTEIEANPVSVNKDVRNKLLREVIISEVPLELQDSLLDGKIVKGVRWKRRYRMNGSSSKLTSFNSDTDTTSDLDAGEKQRLLKR